MLNVKNKPVEIGILEASPQNRSILEFFFKNAGKSVFKNTDVNQCAAVIVDYDFPSSKEKWEEFHQLTKKPGIIISIKETNLPSTIWINKPLTSKALIDAGHKLQALLTTADSEEPATTSANSLVADIDVNHEKITDDSTAHKHGPPIESLNKMEAVSIDEVSIKEDAIEESTLKGDSEENNIEQESIASNPIQDNSEEDNNNNSLDYTISIEEFNTDPEQDIEILQTVTTNQDIHLELEENLVDGLTDDITKSTVENLNTTPELHHDLAEDISTTTEPLASIEIAETTYETETDSDITDNELVIEEALEAPNNNFETIDSELKLLGTQDKTKELDQNLSENKSNLDEVDALLESLIAQGDEKEEIQNKLIEVETPTAKEIIMLDPEDEILPQELVALKKENDNIDDDSPVIVHETSSIHLDPSASNNPLSAEDELQALLDEIRQEAEVNNVDEVNASINTSDRENYIPTAAEERWILTCGDNIAFTKRNVEKTTFNLHDHLLSTLIETLNNSSSSEKIMRIKYRNHNIVICHLNETVYCDESIYSDEYAAICYEPITEEKVKVHNLDDSEIRLYRKKMKDEPENIHSIESFLWTTSIVTSRGRVPTTTKMDQKISLKHWPNITRVEVIPNAMRMAAIFSKRPGTLTELIKWLRVEQRYVIAFYNAALALDLIEFDQDKFRSSSPTGKNIKNRGFFSRLLKRITN